MRIIGREREQAELCRFYESDEAEFVVVYGRRRVGKTFLVREYFQDRIVFSFTGLAQDGLCSQLRNFNDAVSRQLGEGLPPAKDWFEAFNILRDQLELIPSHHGKKKVVFIDEMPWIDTPRSGFITALEHFWNGWGAAQSDLLLIVCGSATSWIVRKLLQNRHGLHNRVTGRILLAPFTLHECEEYFHEAGIRYERKQIVECSMIFGGVPFYLRQMVKGLSLAQNVDRLCFDVGAPLAGEFEELYHSLFRNPDRHIDVIRTLAKKMKGMTREEIVRDAKLDSGGTLTQTLRELEQCGFILKYRDFTLPKNGHYYRVVDPFSLFYLRFVEGAVQGSSGYWASQYGSAMRSAWSGFSYELVCLLHVDQIKRKLGIAGVNAQVSSWRSKTSDPGAQIDLVIDRRDQVINLCEIKFSQSEFVIDKKYAGILQNKVDAFVSETGTHKDIHLTLITTFGVKANSYSYLAQSQVTMGDLFF